MNSFRGVVVVFLITFVVPFSFSQGKEEDFVCFLNVNDAIINSNTCVKICGDQLIQLKEHSLDRTDYSYKEDPDITFYLNVPVSGKYTIWSHVKRIGDLDSEISNICIKMQIGNQRLTKRIVSDIRNYSDHILGNFVLKNQKTEIKIWLPKDIQFVSLEVRNYVPPAVPLQANNYLPQIVPPPTRPRLWVNDKFLPLIKSRLAKEENYLVWTKIRDQAIMPFSFDFSEDQEIFQSVDLEKIVETKAFYYLLSGDKLIGREAIKLLLDYLSVLEYGNINYGDITRNIGHSIYVSALVYDWCNNLLSENEKERLYYKMISLAEQMSIGWPPFNESIVNGHGAEAQVNRDLLAMSIAIYDRDPLPYKYTSYLILEDLVPMRRFEYQSPRHNQGIDYGAYRHMWEMNAAWLFYRMAGVKVFDDNIIDLPLYWIYMRLPNGKMFKDGDMFREKERLDPSYYWKQPEMLLLDYAYSNNAILKGEFLRQEGIMENPILFLLLNNPDLKPTYKLDSLPLSVFTGHVTGSLISRTGWNMSKTSNDVVAEIKGGGYHFGNHQHSDAGAIQIYYHGPQVCDLGLYISYGSPYDFDFNKRSISHSMMLVVDPNESFGKNRINDGGTRFNQRFPKSPYEAQQDEWFNNGSVLSSNIGYLEGNFLYSFYKVDLTKAYSSKITNYIKSYCFINLNREDIPAFIIIFDDINVLNSNFKKFWKINTLNNPIVSDTTIVLQNQEEGIRGKIYIHSLLPLIDNREIVYWHNKDTSNLIAPQYRITSDDPETNGYQIVMSPKRFNHRDRFLNIFQISMDGVKPCYVDFKEEENKYIIKLLNYIIIINSESKHISNSFKVTVDIDSTYIILTDLKEGIWNIICRDSSCSFDSIVREGENSFAFKANRGTYIISPKKLLSTY